MKASGLAMTKMICTLYTVKAVNFIKYQVLFNVSKAQAFRIPKQFFGIVKYHQEVGHI